MTHQRFLKILRFLGKMLLIIATSLGTAASYSATVPNADQTPAGVATDTPACTL